MGTFFTILMIIAGIYYLVDLHKTERETLRDFQDPEWRERKWLEDQLSKLEPEDEVYIDDTNDTDIIMGLKKKENKTQKAQKYIQSKKWNIKRKSVLDRDNYICKRCGAFDIRLSVHHKTYKNHYKEKQDDLISVCDQCHTELHQKHGYPDYDNEEELQAKTYW